MAKHYRKESKLVTFIKVISALLITAALVYFAYSRFVSLSSGENNASEPFVEAAAVSADLASRDAPTEDRQAKVTSSDTAKDKPAAVVSAKAASTDKKKIVKKDELKPVKKTEEKVYGGPKPLFAIIIDDGGDRIEYANRAAALDIPLTWAIIPYRPYTKKVLDIALSKNIPALLHLPMQAVTDKDNSRYIIGEGMSPDVVKKRTALALDSMPGVIGVNNHRGSLSTVDSSLMRPFMQVLKSRGLIFVDSNTIGGSVAYRIAEETGVPALKNRGFLDNTPDKNAIAACFDEAVRNAEKRRALVVICHFRPATIMFLEELNKRKDEIPVRFVTVPEMIWLLKEDRKDNR